MTEIGFHFNVAGVTPYVCRLVRKAARRGASVTLTGDDAALAAIDAALWSFAAEEFVAHHRAERAADVPSRLHAGTAWLALDPLAAPVHDVLVNLSADVPRGFESYARVIEVVSTAEADRAAARERWRAYARRGYAITRHEAAA